MKPMLRCKKQSNVLTLAAVIGTCYLTPTVRFPPLHFVFYTLPARESSSPSVGPATAAATSTARRPTVNHSRASQILQATVFLLFPVFATPFCLLFCHHLLSRPTFETQCRPHRRRTVPGCRPLELTCPWLLCIATSFISTSGELDLRI